ncbi:hypothetical protein N3K66_000312 [Trichothecium roseum]|uniref:Uncharacterized protein n=1 Tax=Trichothecium roseum TaxID=47278 RepID=A0ACC0VDD8_9HYPO|nr:hypothetical protein N3K66_000312 [Trichothecium roseum]
MRTRRRWMRSVVAAVMVCDGTLLVEDISVPTLFQLGDDFNSGFSFNDYVYDHQPPGYSSTPSLDRPTSPAFPRGVPDLVGSLGEVLPVEGSSRTWQWMLDEMRVYPGEFARRGHNVFVHRRLYDHEGMPRAMRTAFGIASSCCLLADGGGANREVLAAVMDAEVRELLKSDCGGGTLLDELARLQALLLYQILRLLHDGNDVAQRMEAERQQDVLFTRAIKLVARSRAELRPEAEAAGWRAWVLAECARRTALVVYMLYGVASIARGEGICVGFPTLARLPLSTALRSWESEDGHREEHMGMMVAGEAEEGQAPDVMSYERFSVLCRVSTRRRLDPFKKFLLVACRGIGCVEALSDAGCLVVEG